jgi:N-acetyl-anhydromuramyl-L-alanine amidase AmpD
LSAITGHQHIAPARKTDPGPCFDWLHYDAVLAEQQQRSQAAAQKSGAALVPAYGALRMIPLVKNVNTLGLKK